MAQRAAFANLWLTRPLVTRQLENRPTTNAMVRTTTAPTIFPGGYEDNVLPSYAKADQLPHLAGRQHRNCRGTREASRS